MAQIVIHVETYFLYDPHLGVVAQNSFDTEDAAIKWCATEERNMMRKLLLGKWIEKKEPNHEQQS